MGIWSGFTSNYTFRPLLAICFDSRFEKTTWIKLELSVRSVIYWRGEYPFLDFFMYRTLESLILLFSWRKVTLGPLHDAQKTNNKSRSLRVQSHKMTHLNPRPFRKRYFGWNVRSFEGRIVDQRSVSCKHVIQALTYTTYTRPQLTFVNSINKIKIVVQK